MGFFVPTDDAKEEESYSFQNNLCYFSNEYCLKNLLPWDTSHILDSNCGGYIVDGYEVGIYEVDNYE